jgi:FMN-dependent oxidoreductase (nitrilotriacetate monooxygenase family)
MADRHMRLGLSLRGLGYHLSAWRHPSVPADGTLNFEYFLHSVRLAEHAKFDMIFFADGIGIRAQDQPPGSLCRSSQNVELEPLTLLSALAPMTRHIGLVTTASTTYNEPYHIARKFASLDHISHGRAGWNVVTSWSEEEALNFNRETHLDYDTRYDRAKEFVQVVTGLWDSWEDDAFLRDKASGIFYDPNKLHVLGHKGRHFSVRGPLSSARTPQGRPIMVQAGASEPGQEIAAQYADVVYTSNLDLPTAQAYYATLKRRLAAHRRAPEHMLVLPAVTPFVGETERQAQEKFNELQALIDPLLGLQQIYRQMGDLSGHPIDGPVPPPNNPQMRSDAVRLYALAQRENLTIRQLYERAAASSSIRVLIGTPARVADDLEQWFTSGAADGFNICPSHSPQGIQDFADYVVPELRRRGLFRTEYEGRTLRENLGLPAQVNRWSQRVA